MTQKEINELLKQQARERRNARLKEQRANETPEQKAERLAKAKKYREARKSEEQKTKDKHSNYKSITKTFIKTMATDEEIKELKEILKNL